MGHLQDKNSEKEIRVFRTTGEVATSASTDYKSDGTWVNTDIYKGQFAVNVEDNKAWYRHNSGITELITTANVNSYVSGGTGVNYLSGLTDVSVATKTYKDVLMYSATTWVNQPSIWFEESDVAENDVFTYNGSAWVNTPAIWFQVSDLAENDIFVYNGTNWVNTPYLQVNVVAPQEGDVLIYSGGTWTNVPFSSL